ncbi:hypothetical protein ACFCYB_25025 [Streptomyces sp. NPDC056309]|uniref:hypothetical protein n=1 Tax=unclassified Streptomyces TaxID=2593676 RepID=UPI0035D67F0D
MPWGRLERGPDEQPDRDGHPHDYDRIIQDDGRFNDLANWAYADLPKVLHPGTNARTAVVRTPAELKEALPAPHDSMLFVEAVMDKYDAPPAAIESGHRMADIDYGPRGPQHRPGT